MPRERLEISDESGDKKYFSQIPHIIVNHSSAYEQSLYITMKRFAGEKGVCFRSLNELARSMKVDKKTVTRTIQKILKRKWIAELQRKKVKGGYVRQFVVVDLWAENMRMYEGGAEMTTSGGGAEKHSFTIKTTFQEGGRQVPTSEVDVLSPEVDVKRTRGGRQRDTKNNPEEESVNNTNTLRKKNMIDYSETEFHDDVPTIDVDTGEKVQLKPLKEANPVSDLLRLFKPVNPSYYLFFRNKTEIASIKRLRATYGGEKLTALINVLPDIINQPYAPRITSPYELETRLGKLKAYFDQEKNKTPMLVRI